MQIDDTMILETSIASRDANGRTLQFVVADMPEAAILKMLRYGAKRIFNDAIGGSDTSTEDKVKAAIAMIERFKRGEIGRVARHAVDAVTALARRKIRASLKVQDKAAWERLKALDTDDQADRLDAILARNPEVRAAAEKEIAAQNRVVAKIVTEGVEL